MMAMDDDGTGDGQADEFIDDTVTTTGFSGEGESRPPKLPVYTTSPKRLWMPIMFCIIFSGLLAMLYYGSFDINFGVNEEEFGFWGALVNALMFVSIGGVSAFVMIKLVKKKGIDVLEKIMMTAFLVLGVFIIYFYGSIGFYFIDQVFPLGDFWYYFLLAFSGGMGSLLVYLYASSRFGERMKNAVVLVYGVLIGSFLPLMIPTWSAILILIGFSLYDIYSVKKGPIKDMMDAINGTDDGSGDEEEDWSNLILDIGIGDLAFYSMLTSISLISGDFGGRFLYNLHDNPFAFIFPFVFTIVGVLIGAFLSYLFVKRHKMIPGLPLSIFIGIGLLALSIVIGSFIF
ncbi:MAG: hypothetical protein ACTSUE_16365 [Promethearchaeota archaeon]